MAYFRCRRKALFYKGLSEVLELKRAYCPIHPYASLLSKAIDRYNTIKTFSQKKGFLSLLSNLKIDKEKLKKGGIIK
jgi:hypothetical protein